MQVWVKAYFLFDGFKSIVSEIFDQLVFIVLVKSIYYLICTSYKTVYGINWVAVLLIKSIDAYVK